jgi:hypothetical protein
VFGKFPLLVHDMGCAEVISLAKNIPDMGAGGWAAA